VRGMSTGGVQFWRSRSRVQEHLEFSCSCTLLLLLASAVRSLLTFCDFCTFLWRLLAFISGDALGEGVAVDAEDGGGVGDVLFVAREGLLYIELFELAHRFVQKDVALQHFVYQGFESRMNQSSFPVNNL
jgi:hypothetical protein